MFKILSSFFEMSENDQAQYLKLPNKFDDTKSFPQAAIQLKYFESLIKRSDEDFDEKKLKVIAILPPIGLATRLNPMVNLMPQE